MIDIRNYGSQKWNSVLPMRGIGRFEDFDTYEVTNLRSKSMLVMVAVVVVILCLTLIKVNVSPPGKTRIILEHTYKTYIAPSCFEQAKVTNNLADSTLSKAQELKYEPESACTEQALGKEKMSLLDTILVKAGLKSSKWSW